MNLLPIIPEEYEPHILKRVDSLALNSEMNETERLFVNGLVRYCKPENILELGVSRGGGSVVLLNAINDIPNSKLVSIDRLEHFYADKRIPVGFDVPENLKSKWTLIKGKDASEVLCHLGQKFDFAVIDTMHLHPVESLNFLCVLPYLNDGATVVLHDISLFLNEQSRGKSLAPRILMSALVCELKIFPTLCGNEFVKNICAFQITQDTRKYIANVFYALALPWEYYPEKDIENVRSLLIKHYDKLLLECFDETVRQNRSCVNFEKTFSIKQLKQLSRKSFDNTIFYGAGNEMKELLAVFDVLNITFDYPIWDVEADNIKSLNGHAVTLPDFETKVTEKTAVITLLHPQIYNSVEEKLTAIGYNVISKKELFAND